MKTSGGTTEGDVFVSQNVLNWRFSSIRGMKFSVGGVRGSSWRMLLGSGQKYHTMGKLIGSMAIENWIEASYSQEALGSALTPARPSRKRETTTPSIGPELEKKLQFLKNLYEKNYLTKKSTTGKERNC